MQHASNLWSQVTPSWMFSGHIKPTCHLHATHFITAEMFFSRPLGRHLHFWKACIFFKKWPLFIHHNIKTNINAKCNIKAINLLSTGQVFVILPFTEWQTFPLGCWCLDWASCLFFLTAVAVDYVTTKCPSSCHLGLLLVNSIAEQFSLYCLCKVGGGGRKADCAAIVLYCSHPATFRAGFLFQRNLSRSQ